LNPVYFCVKIPVDSNAGQVYLFKIMETAINISPQALQIFSGAGRIFSATIPSGCDVLENLVRLARENKVENALVWMRGCVSPVTLGVWDPVQEVSVTERYDGFFEFVSASGRIVQGDSPKVLLTATCAGQDLKNVAGKVFSPTLSVSAQFDLMEISVQQPRSF
jgi:predicted DNA-binding protein with PD1-like motif